MLLTSTDILFHEALFGSTIDLVIHPTLRAIIPFRIPYVVASQHFMLEIGVG
jgi:hypothetical protein